MLYIGHLYHWPSSPDVAQIEESAGQRLLDMEEEKKHREKELESLEEQLRQCTAKSQITDSELQYLLKRLCFAGENAMRRVRIFSVSFMNPAFFVSVLNLPPDFCRESWRVWETPNTSFRLFRARWMRTPPRSSLQQCESHALSNERVFCPRSYTSAVATVSHHILTI